MRKLTLSLMLIILIAIAGLGWGLDQLYNRYSTKQEDNDTVSIYKNIGKDIASMLNHSQDPNNFINAWQRHSQLSLSINNLDSLPLPSELKLDFLNGEPLVLESSENISLHFFLNNSKNVLSLTTPYTKTVRSKPTVNLLFTLFFYCGIIILISLWLYPLIQRLQNLRIKAKAFGEGKLDERIKNDSISYISDIEKEFNNMAQRIQTLVNDNKLLGNAVSHDLRTPLARLRFGIDALAETQDPSIQKKYIDRISNDIDEMQSLVEVLLSYARLDQAMIELKKQPVNISELLNDCINMFSNTKKSITQKIPGNAIYISGDSPYLGILINNLLQNADQYSNKNITISLIEKTHTCELQFEDDGPGIPDASRENIVKPFIRGDTAHKGYGMGLAIVKRITEWHSGEMYIDDAPLLGGAKICISLPKNTFNSNE